jgi:hypothetical protein
MAPRPRHRRPRRRSSFPAVAAVIAATCIGVLLHESPTSSSSTSIDAPTTSLVRAPSGDGVASPSPPPRSLGIADGAVPDGVTVFDDLPAVARLDPALLTALRRAATAADADGVTILVNSGWRSPAYQEHLLQQAITKYGSEREAARWVASPETSEHVAGDAVDVGPSKAATWLSRHGAAYGLCQIYANERWHFELRPTAATRGCPQKYADPTRDPRMQA